MLFYKLGTTRRAKGMTYFSGTFDHKIDTNWRLSVPSEMRKELEGRTNLKMLVSPTGDCLLVFEPEEYEKWVTGLFGHGDTNGLSAYSSKESAQLKVLNSRVRSAEIDASGRIGVAEEFRKIFPDKEATFVGDGKHMEIWQTKNWYNFYDMISLEDL
ncbi:MAG: hypothetical protein FWD72_02870 [Eggerthellaceae bacterium]|nr:hypothetical protein [Eggerthellaceae bacterium]